MNTAYAPVAVRGSRLRDSARSAARLAGRAPLPYVFLGCVVVAAVSLALFPSGLGYDPWCWIVWGRELAHFKLSTAGGPAFKPLPVLIAAALSPTGHAGVAIWLTAARAAALFAPFMAFRVARRFAGTVPALFSACIVALSLITVAWVTLEAYTEPALIVLVLIAVDRHLRGRPGQAFLLGSVAALCRPEVWLFLVAYAALTWRSRRDLRLLFVALLVLLPAAWLAPDMIASHGKDIAGARAAEYRQPLQVVRQAAILLTVPGVVAVVVAAVIATKRRNKLLLALIAAGAAWIAFIAIAGTPQIRYVMAPVAMLALPAGIGGVAIIRAAKTWRAKLLMVACACATLVFPFQAAYLFGSAQPSFAAQYRDLSVAVSRAGGPARVLAHGGLVINPNLQSALAWQLKVPLSRIQRSWEPRQWRAPAVVFQTRKTIASGPAPDVGQRGLRLRVLARTRHWTVLLAQPPGRAS